MGEMLFVHAELAKDAWAGSSITMSQTLPSSPLTPLGPSSPYKITAVGDHRDEITQNTDSSYTTAQENGKGVLNDTSFDAPLQPATAPSNTEPDKQPVDIVGSQSKTQVQTTPHTSQPPSALLRLPLEIRLQIYRWVLLLDTKRKAASGTGTPVYGSTISNGDSGSGSSTASAAKTVNDAASSASMSSTLFHCMPPYFFDSPQHFGPGDGIMFMSMFASNAHQKPLNFRKVIMPDVEKSKEDEDEKDKKEVDSITLLAAYRPVGRALPIGLLTSCRQIYREARTLAFETSEFVFVRLFCSGLSTAHAFVVLGSQTYPGSAGGDIPRLQSWQRDNMRHVRLELDVSVADMGWTGPEREPKFLEADAEGNVRDGPKIIDVPKWFAFCDALTKGLHGMRVLLNITEERYQASMDDETGEMDDGKTEYTAEEATMVAQSVLVQGLSRLAALRQLEIELVWVLRGRFRSRAANMTPHATRNNIMWCKAVETAVNDARQKRTDQLEATSPLSTSTPTYRPVSTKVICVERIYDEEKKKERM